MQSEVKLRLAMDRRRKEKGVGGTAGFARRWGFLLGKLRGVRRGRGEGSS
jgi:hypothetical protein